MSNPWISSPHQLLPEVEGIVRQGGRAVVAVDRVSFGIGEVCLEIVDEGIRDGII